MKVKSLLKHQDKCSRLMGLPRCGETYETCRIGLQLGSSPKVFARKKKPPWGGSCGVSYSHCPSSTESLADIGIHVSY